MKPGMPLGRRLNYMVRNPLETRVEARTGFTPRRPAVHRLGLRRPDATDLTRLRALTGAWSSVQAAIRDIRRSV